ncbi:hypothetical protein CUMW_124640 [Citrus unshiu]|nr:hypothetical protein CUMW_124640 [Citrus unshiu]
MATNLTSLSYFSAVMPVVKFFPPCHLLDMIVKFSKSMEIDYSFQRKKLEAAEWNDAIPVPTIWPPLSSKFCG